MYHWRCSKVNCSSDVWKKYKDVTNFMIINNARIAIFKKNIPIDTIETYNGTFPDTNQQTRNNTYYLISAINFRDILYYVYVHMTESDKCLFRRSVLRAPLGQVIFLLTDKYARASSIFRSHVYVGPFCITFGLNILPGSL